MFFHTYLETINKDKDMYEDQVCILIGELLDTIELNRANMEKIIGRLHVAHYEELKQLAKELGNVSKNT